MKWISVKDKLPLEEYKGRNIVDDFLVTIYPDGLDPNEGATVYIMQFCALEQYFRLHTESGKYENEHSHFVSHWAELPEPAKL